MFMGKYEHILDPKGRLIVPSKYREGMGPVFIVTPGPDGCLFAYPMNEWNNIVEELKKLPGTREARDFTRHFLAAAAEVETDKQGRFLIPSELREKAGLEKEVVFVGVLNRIELWDKERWEEVNSEDNMAEAADKMAELGLRF